MKTKTIAEYIKSEKYAMQNLNCAETILYGANEAFGFNLDKNALKVAAGFGSGMALEKTCGLVTGAIMALSVMCVKDNSRESNIKEIAKTFFAEFEEKFGSTECGVLKSIYADQNGKCGPFIFDGGVFFDEFIAKHKDLLEG